ncbi:putative exported protein precursor [Yersinia enterocolitica]|nr:putative exported protein precursor [Yersinia enterocolitica]
MAKTLKINQAILSALLFSALNSAQAEELIIEHLVPSGFSALEENNTLQLLGVLDGKTLPAPLFFFRRETTTHL